jgi:SAM-dependent methyltransferase
MANRWRFWWSYLRGFTPWDTGITPPEVVALAARLAPGRALDLGCGTGTSSLYLAARGWQIVGVDFVPTAIGQARRKARKAGVKADFHVADVTRLDWLTPAFTLALDVGCLHVLSPEGQAAYAHGLARLVAPDGVYLVYAFQPALLANKPIGLAPDALAALFTPHFTVESQILSADTGSGRPAGWYTLRRTSNP